MINPINVVFVAFAKKYPKMTAKMFKSWKDRFLVLNSHFGFFPNIWNHIRIVLRADIFNLFRISKYLK
jgi:hypothetical protein